jgi:hypothetical protein
VKINLLIELVGGLTAFGLGLLTGLYLAPDDVESDEDNASE